jgi:hypothetical protein
MLRTRARLGGEKADDIAYLVDEQRIVRQLERLATVRLQAERHPHPADRGVGKAALAPLLQAYLGHKNIQHTVRRTELAPARFKSGGGNNSVPSFGTCADADADVSAAAIATIAVRDFISPALWRESGRNHGDAKTCRRPLSRAELCTREYARTFTNSVHRVPPATAREAGRSPSPSGAPRGSHAHPRLRRNLRGRDGRICQELAAPFEGEAIKLESEMQRLPAIEKLMLASPDQQISLTDPDSRSMAAAGQFTATAAAFVELAPSSGRLEVPQHSGFLRLP